MKAKLFVRGLKEPVELENDEALSAQDLIGDSTKTNDTAFSIEGVWTGKKGDMKFVIFPKVEKAPVYSKIEAMTKEEADAFEKDIVQDKVKAVEVYGLNKQREPRDYKWREFYLQRYGAIKLRHVTSPIGIIVPIWTAVDSDLMLDMEKKIESYWEYTRVRDFKEAKQDEHYEKLAEQMGDLTDKLTQKNDTDF